MMNGWASTFLLVTASPCRELAHVSAKGCRKITVRAQMNDILICLDDQEHPALSFHDPDPILYGKAGIRAAGAALKGAVLQSE